MISKRSKIFLTGHKGLVGSEILRKLIQTGYTNILTIDRKKLDLTNQQKVFKFIKKNKPEYIIIAAARVGGIKANVKYPAEFLFQNMAIQNNLIHGAYLNKIKNIIFLGSSCIYPKNCKQPMKESFLLLGKPEETNLSYAIAKIAGVQLCSSYNKQYNTNYISLIVSNSYGPYDNFNLNTSHFLPALIRKCYTAKKLGKKNINLLGKPNTRRELIFSKDVADACIYFLKKNPKEKIINVGSGKDYTIKEYAEFIMKEMNIKLKIKFSGKFSGINKKLLDVRLMKKLGFTPNTNLKKGFKLTFENFLKKQK